jgi:2-polyprenyl-6-methoxyphenol hydroxylase-like FAD-dependent oxidoreductase
MIGADKENNMTGTTDVVIVGGGIAGGATAAALAAGGLDVVVLERQVEFRDRVRGENMQPWGVVEMRRLGLEQLLLDAGGGFCDRVVMYDELRSPEEAEAMALPLGALVDGVPGTFNVGHPQACEALLHHAEVSGAHTVRGVGDVDIAVGGVSDGPSVRYELDGNMHELRARLVIGADGRQSTVRRQIGIQLEQIESTATLGGMLVRTEAWPEDVEVLGTQGDVHFLIFPRPDGIVRLYLARDGSEHVGGPDRAKHFLDAFRLDCCPLAETFVDAEVLGPCAYYTGSDSWSSRPDVDGVVLIGDAAGWSDPIIGQGLSVALRDSRLVSEALLAGPWPSWSELFEPYAVERAERMRRLRMSARLATEMRCTFTPAGRHRRGVINEQMFIDPLMLATMLAPLTGPEVAPPEAFTDENIARILATA